MKKTLFAMALVASVSMSAQAHAFDIGGLVTNAVKEAVTDVATDTTKEVTKEVTKTAVKEAGIQGADKYVDMAVDNSEGIQNAAQSADAVGSMMSSGGAAGTLAKANAALVAADAVRDAKDLGDVEPSAGAVAKELEATPEQAQKNMTETLAQSVTEEAVKATPKSTVTDSVLKGIGNALSK